MAQKEREVGSGNIGFELMLISAIIHSEAGEIALEVSDYGSFYLGQDGEWIEFRAKDIQPLIAALEELAEHLP